MSGSRRSARPLIIVGAAVVVLLGVFVFAALAEDGDLFGAGQSAAEKRAQTVRQCVSRWNTAMYNSGDPADPAAGINAMAWDHVVQLRSRGQVRATVGKLFGGHCRIYLSLADGKDSVEAYEEDSNRAFKVDASDRAIVYAGQIPAADQGWIARVSKDAAILSLTGPVKRPAQAD